MCKGFYTIWYHGTSTVCFCVNYNFMDHITKTPLRVNDEVAQVSKSSPTIFWLKSFFPAALGQETIVKKKRFSSFDKKK